MPEEIDSSFMKIALEQALLAANRGEVPVGAVLVMDGEIFAGHNRMIMDHDPTAHAEIVVLRQAAAKVLNYRIIPAELYVTLEPCIMCVGAIVQARIRRLIYGAAEPRYGAVESMVRAFDLGVNHKPEIISGVMADEAGKILKEFFLARR